MWILPNSRTPVNACWVGIYLNFASPAKDAYSGLNIMLPGCQAAQRDPGPGCAKRLSTTSTTRTANGSTTGRATSARIERQDAFLKAMITVAKSKVSPLTVMASDRFIHEGVIIDDGSASTS